MSALDPTLEWTRRRRAGESAALIAREAGVTPLLVRRATSLYGPFPQPSRQLGRTITAGAALEERTRRWVLARQRGRRVSDIARAEGVGHQIVSRFTEPAGPFPSGDVVQAWVQARRSGTPVADLAAEYEAPEATVLRATRPWGPFWRTGPRLPDGVVGVKGIAKLAGMSDPAAIRWVRTGRAPEPDFVLGDAHKLWLESTIRRWLDSCDLASCPDCGARCVSVNRHRAGAHKARRPGRPEQDSSSRPTSTS